MFAWRYDPLKILSDKVKRFRLSFILLEEPLPLVVAILEVVRQEIRPVLCSGGAGDYEAFSAFNLL